MSRFLYFLNVLYISLIPTLAMITQGTRDHEYLKAFDFLPEKTANWMDIGMWLFVIVLIAILGNSIKPTTNLKNSLGLLFGAPILGLVTAIVVGGNLSYMFFNLYLIEGVSFLIVFIIQIFRHRKRGIKEAGPIIVYLITPLLFLIFFIGFLSSINFDFLFKNYVGFWDQFALLVCVIIGSIGMYKFIDESDKEFRKENPVIDLKDGETLKYQELDPLAGVALVIGVLLFTGHGMLMKWDWLTSVLH